MKTISHIGLLTSCLIFSSFPNNSFAQFFSNSLNSKKSSEVLWTAVRQGSLMKLWISDQGVMGADAASFAGISDLGCEYLRDPDAEHIYGMCLKMGAIKDIGIPGQPQYKKIAIQTQAMKSDYFPTLAETRVINTYHPWYYTSIFNLDEPNKRGIDDDDDGKIDEDELDGDDNDGDGKIDEDYGAVSESDYYCYYTDTVKIVGVKKQPSLGLKFIQRSYAWANTMHKPIIVFEIAVVNISKKPLMKVYTAIDVLTWVCPIWVEKAYFNQVAGYWHELITGYVYNPVDMSSPIGITMLSLPKKLGSLDYFYCWNSIPNPTYNFDPNEGEAMYNLLSGALYPPGEPIRPDQDPADRGVVNLFFSYGPVDTLNVNDTLRFSFAVVGGYSLRYGPDNLFDNAKAAQALYARNYHPFFTTPAPKLRIEPGYKSVTLNWAYTGSGVNPVETWDDANQLIQLYPEDHWRRINPPEGHTTGGRIFEGYRLYRSEDPAGTAKSFVMLRQWDMIDSVGPKFGYDTGIETTFVDENLTTGKTYWYAVTSFGIPDVHVMDYVDWDGSVKVETLAAGSSETSVLASRKRMKLPFSVSHQLDKVLVVPNPYRVDADYTLEMGGYEGRARVWSENKRMIKFIHLPPKCTIRIFTMAGEIIATLLHEDETRGEIDWNMLSESNRAIASGVYIFTVESEYGTQTGKFVVIR